MRHATLQDLNAVYGHFQSRRDVFPHIRKDKLERIISAGECVYQDGVVLTYHQNKVPAPVIATSSYKAPEWAVIIHQLLNSQPFNGAAGRVFDQFVKEMSGSGVHEFILSVRADNAVACAFYERHGMQVVGRGTWANGSIRGLIYWLGV